MPREQPSFMHHTYSGASLSITGPLYLSIVLKFENFTLTNTIAPPGAALPLIKAGFRSKAYSNCSAEQPPPQKI